MDRLQHQGPGALDESRLRQRLEDGRPEAAAGGLIPLRHFRVTAPAVAKVVVPQPLGQDRVEYVVLLTHNEVEEIPEEVRMLYGRRQHRMNGHDASGFVNHLPEFGLHQNQSSLDKPGESECRRRITGLQNVFAEQGVFPFLLIDATQEKTGDNSGFRNLQRPRRNVRPVSNGRLTQHQSHARMSAFPGPDQFLI